MVEEHIIVLNAKNNIMLVCITGKTGAGKTTFLKIAREMNYDVFEVDEYIHSLYDVGNLGYKLILSSFGPEYVNDKQVDRNKLRQLILSNQNMHKKLDEIMIPIIFNKILELREEYTKLNKIIFIELAIYINHENYFKKLFDKVILIKSEKNFKFNLKNKKNIRVKKNTTFSVGNLEKLIQKNKINHNFSILNTSNLKDFEIKIRKILDLF